MTWAREVNLVLGLGRLAFRRCDSWPTVRSFFVKRAAGFVSMSVTWNKVCSGSPQKQGVRGDRRDRQSKREGVD